MTLATERTGDADHRSDDLSEPAARAARHLRRPSLAPAIISFAGAVIDLILFSLAAWFALYALTPATAFHPVAATGLAALSGLTSVLVATTLGAYRMAHMLRPLRSMLRGAAAFVGPAFLVHLLSRGDTAAMTVLMVLSLAGLAVVVPSRLVLASAVDWAYDSGLTQRRAIVYGGGPEAERLLRALSERPNNDIRIFAIFDDRGAGRVSDLTLDVPKIGRFDDLVAFCRRAEIDLILITLPPTAERRIAHLLDRLRVLPAPVHLTAFSIDYAFRDGRESLSALLPASFRPERRITKRCFDLVFATLALVLAAPVMLAAAIAIRAETPGPILFGQLRHGFNNRPIRVWKFRTMYVDQCDPDARLVVTRGDPRVTRVGRVLRRTSIDELPQLFNVLAGSLSLVGPRPHAVDARSSRQVAFDKMVEGYSARHRLPPGITGWAQINGWRGEVSDPDSLRARVACDLFYIENWSIWFDLRILLRTPLSLLDTRRAY